MANEIEDLQSAQKELNESIEELNRALQGTGE